MTKTHKSTNKSIVFDGAGKNPKSTLIGGWDELPVPYYTTKEKNTVISLFKDTLLKEIEEVGEINGYLKRDELKKIIKNL